MGNYLKIVSRDGRTHVEDDSGHRIWGVKSIKYEVSENGQAECTIVMFGVVADLEVDPLIKVTPVIPGKGPIATGKLKPPRKKKAGRSWI